MLSTMIILSFRSAVENLNLRVVGSSPTLGAYSLFFFFFFEYESTWDPCSRLKIS